MSLALFDLDDTLCEYPAAFARWAASFADEHGLDTGEAVAYLEDGRRAMPSIESYFDGIRDRFGITAPSIDLAAAFVEGVAGKYEVHDDVLKGIGALREEGWRVGIVTNGPGTQQIKIRATGLDEAVDGYVVSGIEGFDKPNPEVFRRAAKACGATLEDAWMVGDNTIADIGGAKLAGLRSIWITLGRDWPEPAYAPDHIVDGPLEAIDIIRAA